jgi:hypothetical protein
MLFEPTQVLYYLKTHNILVYAYVNAHMSYHEHAHKAGIMMDRLNMQNASLNKFKNSWNYLFDFRSTSQSNNREATCPICCFI